MATIDIRHLTVPSISRGRLVVGATGDSRLALDRSGAILSPYGGSNQTPLYWLRMLSGQNIDVPNELNFAVTGANTRDHIQGLTSGDTPVTPYTDQIAAWTDAGASAIIMQIGTNDPTNGIPYSETVPNMTQMVEQAREAGLLVVVITETGRGGAADVTPEERMTLRRIVEVQRSFGTKPGVFVVDAAAITSKPLSTTPLDPRDDVLKDGVHYSPTGALMVARELFEVFDGIWPTGLVNRFASNADLWQADFTEGNLLLNGMMDGSAGNADNGATGDVATSWSLGGAALTDMTVDGSKFVDADGEAWQEVRFSGTPPKGWTRAELTQNLSGPTFAIGDAIHVSADVWLVSGNDTVRSVEFGLENGAHKGYDGASATSDAKQLPSDAVKGRVKLRGFTLAEAGAPKCVLRIMPMTDGRAVDAVVRIRACEARLQA